MKQVFIAEPMFDGFPPNGVYKVIRLLEDGERQETAFYGLSKEDAEEQARELNEEFNNQKQ